MKTVDWVVLLFEEVEESEAQWEWKTQEPETKKLTDR